MCFFFFQAEDGIRDFHVTGVQTCALPIYVLRGVKVLRAIPVWSDRLGLSGRCDVVEKHRDGTLVPVEFKKSRRKSFINDDVQVRSEERRVGKECRSEWR